MLGLLVADHHFVHIVEQDDPLLHPAEHRKGDRLRHIVRAVGERGPVHEDEAEAVSENGVIQPGEDRAAHRKQEDRVHQHDADDRRDEEQVLLAVPPRRPDGFAYEDEKDDDNEDIAEYEVQMEQRLHVVRIVRRGEHGRTIAD